MADHWDAEAVAALRRRLGLSQAQLAQAVGVRQQTVSEWETGLHAPKGTSLRMLRMVAEERAPYAADSPRARRRGR